MLPKSENTNSTLFRDTYLICLWMVRIINSMLSESPVGWKCFVVAFASKSLGENNIKHLIGLLVPFSFWVAIASFRTILLHLLEQTMTNTLAETLAVVTYFSGSINVVEHRHEQGYSLKLFWIYLSNAQKLLNMSENLDRCEFSKNCSTRTQLAHHRFHTILHTR